MNDWLHEIDIAWNGWAPAATVFVVGALLGWIGRVFLLRKLRKISAKTATRIDDALVDASRGLWLPTAVFLSLMAALRFAPIAGERRLVGHTLTLVGLSICLTLFASRFVGIWFRGIEHDERGLPAQPSLIAKASRGTVIVLGLLITMQGAGFQITPLLTALGVGSLAVGLALQPTLSNLFAGLYLSTSKPIRVGDFIELEDGTQGEVVDIGWRATKVRQMANNLAIVPNARLGEMRILNYSLPVPTQSTLVAMGVAYDSDLRQVERVVLEVAKALQLEVPEADREHEPAVRFHTFGDSSINFNVVLRARAITDRFALIHEFVKRIKERFDAEGIEIPFPQRVVHLPAGEEETAEPAG